MKGYNDTLMLLDYLEGDTVVKQQDTALKYKWFKKMDKQLRNPANSKDQWDNVRPLNDTDKQVPLNSVDDLITNNFITNRDFHGLYKPKTSKQHMSMFELPEESMEEIRVKVLQEHYHLNTIHSVCGDTMDMKKGLSVMHQINIVQKLEKKIKY